MKTTVIKTNFETRNWLFVLQAFFASMLVLAVLLASGCSAVQQTNIQQLNDAKSFGDFLDSIKTITVRDVNTALADVHAHGDQDLAALQCYPALIEFIQSNVTVQAPTIDGVISANQLKRDILLGISGGNSPVKAALRKLHVACAAYLSDERRFAIEFGLMVGAASHGVPPSIIGGLLPAGIGR